MKTLLLALVCILPLTAFAAPPPVVSKPLLIQYDTNKLTRVDGPIGGRITFVDKGTAAESAKSVSELYKAKEFNIETAYVLRTEDLDRYKESVSIGGNYFITKGAGFHAAVALKDFDDQGIDLVEFGLVGRVPFEKIRTAILFGVGAEHAFVIDTKGKQITGGEKDPKKPVSYSSGRDDEWRIYAEAGPVVRLNDHLDVFAKVRGVRPIAGAEKEHIAILLGMDFPF